MSDGDFTRLSKTGQILLRTGYGYAGFGGGPYGGVTVETSLSTAWTGVSNPSFDFTYLSRTGQQQIVGGYGLGKFGEGGFGEGTPTVIAVNTETISDWTAYTTK